LNSTIIKTICGICQIGCGILVHIDNGEVIKIEGDPESPLNKGGAMPQEAGVAGISLSSGPVKAPA